MSSRLDRNLITVVTGQAADNFDHLFRFLYMTSSHVDLSQVTTAPEPEPDPRPELFSVASPSASVAKKLYNPKYALVALSNPTTSVGNDNPKENSKKESQKKVIKEATKDAYPLHPGLTNLEKACLISYLPTWPEPDPPSDVIGFINIRDTSKPIQVHLQRSEMFETSQAIRFSSPFSKPQEDFPEVTKPRQPTEENEEVPKLQPGQSKLKTEQLVDGAQESEIKSKGNPPEQKSAPHIQNSEPSKHKTESKLNLNIVTDPYTGQSTSYLGTHTLSLSNSKTPLINGESSSHKAQNITTTSDSSPESNRNKKDKTVNSLETQKTFVYGTHTLDSNNTHTSQLSDPTASNTEEETPEKSVVSRQDTHTKTVNIQAEVTPEMTHDLQTPSMNRHIPTSFASAMKSEDSTSFSKNNLIAIKTVQSSTAASPDTSLPSTTSLSSFPPNPASSFSKLNLPLPSSYLVPSVAAAGPPIPNPRTVQLVIKDSSVTDSQTLPKINIVRKSETSAGQQVVQSEPAAATVHTSTVDEPESTSALQGNSAYHTEDLKDTDNTNDPEETSQQKQYMISQETAGEEADGRHDGSSRAQSVSGTQIQMQPGNFMTDAPETASVNFKETILKEVHSKTLTSTDSITEADFTATTQIDPHTSEKTLADCEFGKGANVTESQIYLAKAHEPQSISYSKSTSNNYTLETVNWLKDPIHNASHNVCIPMDRASNSMHTSAPDPLSQEGKTEQFTNDMPNSEKPNTHSTTQEQTLKTQRGARTPVKEICGHTSDARELHLCLLSPKPGSPTAIVRTPSSEGAVSLPSTPDLLATPTDSQSCTADFRTTSPDTSEGYVSPRGDSALSNTSEEYYECSDSPLHEPVPDQTGFHHYGTKENYINLSTSSVIASGSSPALVLNSSFNAVTPSSAEQESSSSETESLSRTSGVSCTSLLEMTCQKSEPEVICEEEGKAEDQKEKDVKKAEPEYKNIEGTEREEAQRVTGPFKQDDNGAQAQEMPAAADGDVTVGESNCQEMAPKQSPSDDLTKEAVSSEGERPDKSSLGREKALNHAAVRPCEVATRESQSTRETERQKVWTAGKHMFHLYFRSFASLYW